MGEQLSAVALSFLLVVYVEFFDDGISSVLLSLLTRLRQRSDTASLLTAQDVNKGWLRALPARRPRRRRGTIDKSAIYPHTNK